MMAENGTTSTSEVEAKDAEVVGTNSVHCEMPQLEAVEALKNHDRDDVQMPVSGHF